jgi:PAS domain S-box-containing protein
MPQRVPIILLTGLTDTKIAPQALVMGAQDYLIKGDFDEKLLARAVRYSLERVRNLQFLRESEERYRELFNNNPMPMWVFDAATYRFLEANSAAIQHYGYTHEEFLGKTLADIRLSGNEGQLREEVAAIRGVREGVKKGIIQHRKKSGEVIFADIAWHNINYRDRPAILVLANDVTERIQLEEELNEQRLSRQKQITEAVILAQEKERTEIGKELHDNVNQILGASNLYINTAMTDDEMRQELLERSTELVSNAINEIRKISKSLITPGPAGDRADRVHRGYHRRYEDGEVRYADRSGPAEYCGGPDRRPAKADAVQDRAGAAEQYRQACAGDAGADPVVGGERVHRADHCGQRGGL